MVTLNSFGRLQAKLFSPQSYIQFLGIVGILLAAWGIYEATALDNLAQFAVLSLLAALAEFASARQKVNESAINYEVSSVVGLASIPYFGLAGLLIDATANIIKALNLAKLGELDAEVWLRTRVNIGMHGVGFLVVYLLWNTLSPANAFQTVLVWALMAVLYDQINFALLATVLRVVQGPKFKLRDFWIESRWAMLINIAVTAIGGGLLSYAIYAYDWEGILIFFLPVLLSLFAFHTTVQHYQKTMDELEGIVSERTEELRAANAELAETNQQLSVLNADLTRANQANNRFLAVLSHDMRSPLTGIKLYGQMLQRRPDMDPDKRIHMMQVILQNTQTLVELVDNLVEIEQSGNDALALQFEHVDLNSLLHEVAFNFEAHAVEKQIVIDVQLASAPVVVRVDRQLIKRSITNLVSNAIKYTGEHGKVTLSVREEDGEANIRIADTGIGIPANEIDRIFESYHRVDAHRAQAQGLGLGLSIVKRYIDLHDGEIFVTSIVGEGSQFNVYLPLACRHNQSADRSMMLSEMMV